MIKRLAAFALCLELAACAVPGNSNSSYGPSYDSAGIHVDGGASDAAINSWSNKGGVHSGVGAGGGGGGGHH